MLRGLQIAKRTKTGFTCTKQLVRQHPNKRLLSNQVPKESSGEIPSVLSEYAEEKAAATSSGLLFSDRIMDGPVKWGIAILSVGVGVYTLLEGPVSCPSRCLRFQLRI